MRQNIGNLDRSIRLLIAVMFGIFYLTGIITGATATVLLILALIFVFTSLIKFCPLYIPFKISTIKKSTTEQKEKSQ